MNTSLKQVVAIFDATQTVRKSPGTLAGDGDLGHLEGITAWGHERRFRDLRGESGLPLTPERLRQRSELTLRARALNRFAIVAAVGSS